MPEPACPPPTCAYCGLPLAAAPRAAEPGERFCCFGCRFASQAAGAGGETGRVRTLLLKLGFAVFCTMNVMMFTMALWTQDVYADGPGGEHAAQGPLYEMFRYLCLVFSLPVLLLLGGPLLENALAELRRGSLSGDLLLAVGVAASFAYSFASVLGGEGHIYFEVGCVVLTAVTLGRWFEASGKLKTTEALRSLNRLLPEDVRVVSDGGERQARREAVAVGETIRVLPGERIALDGRLRGEGGALDEQLVTGEATPVWKRSGDAVYSGSLNLDGDLRIEVTAPAAAGTLQRLVEAVTAAALRKDRYQRLADRIAAWFLPGTLVTALGAFAWHAWRQGGPEGVLVGLSVLLIACPCALGLATPLAMWAALGRASRGQVLVRDGDALARLAEIDCLAFDKTGTLTSGDPQLVAAVFSREEDQEPAWAAAAALAAGSTHPLSGAILRARVAAEDAVPALAAVGPVRTVPGRGVQAEVPGLGLVWLGSARWLAAEGLALPAALGEALGRPEQRSAAHCLVGWQGEARGLFLFAERLRPEAEATLQALSGDGFQLVMLTGDRRERAETLAAGLGLAVEAELLPEEKLAAVERWRRAGRRVGMVGDGLNDAPALAAADVGVALGCGADVSRHSADFCLLGNDLGRIPWTIELARRTVRTIRWNLFWAFAYNTLGIGLAAAGLLNPILAAVAMTASSALVISNSLRLAYGGGEALGDRARSMAHGESEPDCRPEREPDEAPGGEACVVSGLGGDGR